MSDSPGPGTAELRICPGCGAIAPTQGTKCVRCKTSLASPLTVHDPVTGFWVGVEAMFKCRACGHRSPINFLDVDGDVRCLRCGIDQELARDLWWDGLALAHAAGDLHGPGPEGQFPTGRPLAHAKLFDQLQKIGVEKTYAESSQGGVVIDGGGVHSRSLLVRALPGHPLCATCKRPLEVTACEHDDLSVRCPECGDAHTYRRPRLPKSLHALAGVVAMEHEKGGRDAKLDQDASGAQVIACPACGAPLDVDGTTTVVRCKFCSVSVRIPSETLRGAGHDHPKLKRWWLYFTAASHLREQLEQQAVAHAEKAARQTEEAEAKAAQERAAQEAEAAAMAEAAARQRRTGIAVAVVAVVLVALGGLVAYLASMH